MISITERSAATEFYFVSQKCWSSTNMKFSYSEWGRQKKNHENYCFSSFRFYYLLSCESNYSSNIYLFSLLCLFLSSHCRNERAGKSIAERWLNIGLFRLWTVTLWKWTKTDRNKIIFDNKFREWNYRLEREFHFHIGRESENIFTIDLISHSSVGRRKIGMFFCQIDLWNN